MNNLTNQTPRLAVTMPGDTTEWYRVLDVEAGATGATKALTVAGGHWLDMGTYGAVLVDGDNRTPGSFAVLFCRSDTAPLRFVGTWTPAAGNS